MFRKINKAQYDALHDEVKKLYKAEGENYVLGLADTDPDNDPAELRRALIRERGEKATEKTRADELQTKLDGITNTNARKAGDIDAIESSYNTKLATQKSEFETKLKAKDDYIKKILVKDKALVLATKLAGENADLILPHIETRLKADLDGAEPITRVLDASGQLSASTIDDLEKEFVANKKFSAIIIASKASGGANGDRARTSAVPNGKKFSDLTEAERVEWAKTDKPGFIQARDEHQASMRKY